jgi:hypothetical protein
MGVSYRVRAARSERRVMPQHQFRVFLSAVTSEFGKARDALGADLRSRELLLRVQSDFRQEWESDTTLKKLHDYIRDCSAVVCVIGKRRLSANARARGRAAPMWCSSSTRLRTSAR